MIRRIRTVRPLPDFLLSVSFDDGKRVVYDVKEDMGCPVILRCGMCGDCLNRCSSTQAEPASIGTAK